MQTQSQRGLISDCEIEDQPWRLIARLRQKRSRKRCKVWADNRLVVQCGGNECRIHAALVQPSQIIAGPHPSAGDESHLWERGRESLTDEFRSDALLTTYAGQVENDRINDAGGGDSSDQRIEVRRA